MSDPLPAGPPEGWSRESTLRDGTTVMLRPISQTDREALHQFHEGLSSRTVYLRFFSAHPHLSDSDLDYFTQVDHRDRVALVAEVSGEIVGVGRFDRLDSDRAEVAFVVTDRMQGFGLGGLLLSRLVEMARSLGVTTFVAEVLPGNMRMLGAFRHSGLPVTERVVEDVVEVSFPLSAG